MSPPFHSKHHKVFSCYTFEPQPQEMKPPGDIFRFSPVIKKTASIPLNLKKNRCYQGSAEEILKYFCTRMCSFWHLRLILQIDRTQQSSVRRVRGIGCQSMADSIFSAIAFSFERACSWEGGGVRQEAGDSEVAGEWLNAPCLCVVLGGQQPRPRLHTGPSFKLRLQFRIKIKDKGQF